MTAQLYTTSVPPLFFSSTSHSSSPAPCTRSAREHARAHPPSHWPGPWQADDHAARLARFAIAAMAAAGEVPVDEEGPDPAARVQIRIGMHCGPVSASVVGTQVRAGARAALCCGVAARSARRDREVCHGTDECLHGTDECRHGTDECRHCTVCHGTDENRHSDRLGPPAELSLHCQAGKLDASESPA